MDKKETIPQHPAPCRKREMAANQTMSFCSTFHFVQEMEAITSRSFWI